MRSPRAALLLAIGCAPVHGSSNHSPEPESASPVPSTSGHVKKVEPPAADLVQDAPSPPASSLSAEEREAALKGIKRANDWHDFDEALRLGDEALAKAPGDAELTAAHDAVLERRSRIVAGRWVRYEDRESGALEISLPSTRLSGLGGGRLNLTVRCLRGSLSVYLGHRPSERWLSQIEKASLTVAGTSVDLTDEARRSDGVELQLQPPRDWLQRISAAEHLSLPRKRLYSKMQFTSFATSGASEVARLMAVACPGP